MTFPTIHLNGTSARDLLEEYCKASNAISKAIDAVAHAWPNARDYYTEPGSAVVQAALAEHADRLKRLRDIRQEIESILENITEQEDARAARKR